jgi:predicted secreted protein
MCESFEYEVKISKQLDGQALKLKNFPELMITYVKGENHLCPSNYRDTVCFWEGDITLTLEVNGRPVTLNDHDKRKNNESRLETDKYKYSLQGIGPLVENRSREETYLIFSVERCPIEQIKSYRLGELFTVRLSANASTGYKWEVETTPGLSIVGTDYESSCDEPVPGCGGYNIWILKGTRKGTQQFTGRYRQSWEHERVTPKVLTFQIY